MAILVFQTILALDVRSRLVFPQSLGVKVHQMEMEICKQATWYCPSKGIHPLVRVCGSDREAVCKEFDMLLAEAMEDCPPAPGVQPTLVEEPPR